MDTHFVVGVEPHDSMRKYNFIVISEVVDVVHGVAMVSGTN